ncbi:hypothetical protein B0H13DRAFT_2577765 [Mycena leptocephala]|nr:hypothetical protein B0H13DRAFT_2577765 [Mycena leptocephala]
MGVPGMGSATEGRGSATWGSDCMAERGVEGDVSATVDDGGLSKELRGVAMGGVLRSDEARPARRAGMERERLDGGVGSQMASCSKIKSGSGICANESSVYESADAMSAASRKGKGGAEPQWRTSRMPLSACSRDVSASPCSSTPSDTSEYTESPSIGERHGPGGLLSPLAVPRSMNSRCVRGLKRSHAQNTATTIRMTATPPPSAMPMIAPMLCAKLWGAGHGRPVPNTPVETVVKTLPPDVYTIVVVKREPERGPGAVTTPSGRREVIRPGDRRKTGGRVKPDAAAAERGAFEESLGVKSVSARQRDCGGRERTADEEELGESADAEDKMMDEALIDGTEAEMLVVSLEETPCEAEVADTLTAVEEADGISVSPVVETEGESLSDSVVVAESGGEVVLVSGVVVAVEVESGAESVSDSEVAESGGEAEVITGVVVVVDAVSGVVVAVEVESGAESVSDSEVAESGEKQRNLAEKRSFCVNSLTPTSFHFLALPSVPWMENGNLQAFLTESKELYSMDRLISWILDVALGLRYLHDKDIVHGDLKARAQGGTIRYQAPELHRGGHNDLHSDIYAFACVAHQLLAGKHPFPELRTDGAVIKAVLDGLRPSRPSSCSGTPRSDGLWTLLQDCWEELPEKRPTAVQTVDRLMGPVIQAKTVQSSADWDDTFTSKFRRSLLGQPTLPSVPELEQIIFVDETALGESLVGAENQAQK